MSDELANGLVRVGGHDEDLHEENVDRDNKVNEKELLKIKCIMRSCVDQSVEEKDRTGRVEGAGEQSQNEP